MIYYSASSTWRRSCIGYAVSQEIEGPYTYVSTVIYSVLQKTESQTGKVREIPVGYGCHTY